MGIYNSLSKSSSRGETKTYDGHSITANDVLNGAADGIRPDSNIQWQVQTPTTIQTPTTATIEEAEREELEAIDFENAVKAGIRVLKARSKKVQQNVQLVTAHRGHLKTVAKATLGIATANAGLANTLQGLRAGFAQLGHSLDQKTQTIDHKVETLKAKYGQRQG